MKKYIFVVVILIFFVLLGFWLYKPVDSQGWSRVRLVTDSFSKFFPLNFSSGFYLLSINEKGMFDSDDKVTKETAYIEARDGSQINFGSKDEAKIFTILQGRRALYATKKFDEAPVFKVWTEQVSSEEFPKYISVALGDLANLSPKTDAINIKNSNYKNHDFTTYLRKNLTASGLKGNNSIGGAYIFFPEKNTILSIFLFNTKYNTPEAYLISEEELDQTIHEFIDSVIVN